MRRRSITGRFIDLCGLVFFRRAPRIRQIALIVLATFLPVATGCDGRRAAPEQSRQSSTTAIWLSGPDGIRHQFELPSISDSGQLSLTKRSAKSAKPSVLNASAGDLAAALAQFHRLDDGSFLMSVGTRQVRMTLDQRADHFRARLDTGTDTYWLDLPWAPAASAQDAAQEMQATLLSNLPVMNDPSATDDRIATGDLRPAEGWTAAALTALITAIKAVLGLCWANPIACAITVAAIVIGFIIIYGLIDCAGARREAERQNRLEEDRVDIELARLNARFLVEGRNSVANKRVKILNYSHSLICTITVKEFEYKIDNFAMAPAPEPVAAHGPPTPFEIGREVCCRFTGSPDDPPCTDDICPYGGVDCVAESACEGQTVDADCETEECQAGGGG